ncbi:tRNA-dihydrouridine(47) synthase [NAD(P)(+)]-like [Sinocyclocheilus grahami]|uniref:tRNA-dihydrouridine(47) synthase [NAD(P)(+)]-like n=1 Tax=Sinocyclocheilus grahami TaxID=75366 RepID=UPI0007AD0F6A|nr:PREDICTED: tRNA-dihydrouridine(47) synthase [NAD(P)(+)]-like [Sinocyclocheilus grahami]
MESAVEVQRGAAAIKEQFLTTKEKFHEFLASGRPRQSTDEADGDSEEPSGEPEQKRVRLDSDGDEKKKKKKRGQNKSRPHVKPQSYEDRRLCPSIVQERDTKCFYGEKCRFLHDVSEYMSTKAADLSDQCYLFNSFGWCQYGVTCRFAKAHTSPELKNLRNQDFCRRSAVTVRNLLDKELQRRLRKKQERFPGAEAYLKTVSRGEKPASNQEENLSGAGHTQLLQLEGCFPDTMTRCAELLNLNIDVDFVDINSGCPIDLVYKKGGGCGLMTRTSKFEQIVRGMNSVLDVPLTVKIRTGVQQNCSIAHKLIPEMKKWGVSLITLHGRSREQRYTKSADWEYIDTCSKLAAPVPLFGNGDILSYEDAMKARETGVSGIMVARGALIKPWLFTEIKENRHWDISSGERLDILRDFTNYGLEHWGSDTQGVEKTRSFLLEWLSFLCR